MVMFSGGKITRLAVWLAARHTRRALELLEGRANGFYRQQNPAPLQFLN